MAKGRQCCARNEAFTQLCPSRPAGQISPWPWGSHALTWASLGKAAQLATQGLSDLGVASSQQPVKKPGASFLQTQGSKFRQQSCELGGGYQPQKEGDLAATLVVAWETQGRGSRNQGPLDVCCFTSANS